MADLTRWWLQFKVLNSLATHTRVSDLDPIEFRQEPMSRSMQLNHIPVTAFSQTDLFLDRIYFEWDSRDSTITNYKTLIDATASLDRNCLSLTIEKVY